MYQFANQMRVESVHCSGDLQRVVKNTFLHFWSEEDMVTTAQAPRSKSAPALTRLSRQQLPQSTAPFLWQTPRSGSNIKKLHGERAPSPQSLHGSTQSPPSDESVNGSRRSGFADHAEDDEIETLSAVTPTLCAEDVHGREEATELCIDGFGSENQIDTVMMKNIPCGCSHQEVRDVIDEAGFKGRYNFFYLPSRRCKENMGYAFIGFPDPITVKIFINVMAGFRFTSRKSNKVVAVVPASIQGFQNNYEHFRGTRVANSKWPPLFFDIGLPARRAIQKHSS